LENVKLLSNANLAIIMKVLIDMTFVTEDILYLSLPRVAMRFLHGISAENRNHYCLLFEESSASGMHRLLPEFDYLTVNLFRQRKSRMDFRYFMLPSIYKKAVDNSGCDVLFIPGEGWFATILKFKIPSVVVIHDIKQYKKDYVQYNEQTGFVNRISSFVKKICFKKNLYKADRIITVSEYTCQDIIQYFPRVKAEKIRAIHNTVAPIEYSKKPNGLTYGKEYILNVNSIHQFKNPMTLIKAFEKIMNDIKYDLVLVGRQTGYWTEAINPYILEHHLEGRIIRLENLEDSELRYLYENTKLFVTPSLHEGFGFTPVEAAIYGAPVISSKSESLPEATMGLVRYYEPATDENVLAKTMLDMLQNPPSPSELSQISETFKEEYSPRRQVEQTEKIFRQVLKEYENIN